jgi:hypothetical protein
VALHHLLPLDSAITDNHLKCPDDTLVARIFAVLNAVHPTWRLHATQSATIQSLAQANPIMNLALWLTQTVKGLQ